METRHPDDATQALADPVTLATFLDRKYQRRPHLDVISSAFRDMREGGPKRLAISTPPQVGKSLLCAWAAFWWLIKDPTARIVIASYADSLAIRHGKNVRSLVAEYGELFGIELHPASHAANDWEITTGGGVRSCGVKSGLTGRPADIIFCDDPHKDRAEADSRTYREAVHDWWSSTAYSRLSPGACVVQVATRWHEDDLIGRLTAREGRVEDGGRWRVLSLPALCTDPERDPLGRALGDPLPHPRISDGDTEELLEHWHDRRRASTPRDWGALYQGDPQPAEGTLLKADEIIDRRHWGPGKDLPASRRVAVAVDPSGGGRDTAGVIGGFLGEDSRVYLTHDVTMRGPADKWARAACKLAGDIQADVIVYEHNYGGDMARSVIRTAWDALAREGTVTGPCPMVKPVHGKRSKTLRAEPIAQAWREGHVWTGAYLPDVESEWASWQVGKESPGRIDASVYLVLELLPTPGTKVNIHAPEAAARITRGTGSHRKIR